MGVHAGRVCPSFGVSGTNAQRDSREASPTSSPTDSVVGGSPSDSVVTSAVCRWWCRLVR